MKCKVHKTLHNLLYVDVDATSKSVLHFRKMLFVLQSGSLHINIQQRCLQLNFMVISHVFFWA